MQRDVRNQLVDTAITALAHIHRWPRPHRHQRVGLSMQLWIRVQDQLDLSCADGCDNDGGGYLDCVDFSCATAPTCSQSTDQESTNAA